MPTKNDDKSGKLHNTSVQGDPHNAIAIVKRKRLVYSFSHCDILNDFNLQELH